MGEPVPGDSEVVAVRPLEQEEPVQKIYADAIEEALMRADSDLSGGLRTSSDQRVKAISGEITRELEGIRDFLGAYDMYLSSKALHAGIRDALEGDMHPAVSEAADRITPAWNEGGTMGVRERPTRRSRQGSRSGTSGLSASVTVGSGLETTGPGWKRSGRSPN